MNINRDYLIINDVKKSNIKLDNGSMFFYITDKNTQNIFVNLVINVSNNDLIQKYANIENAEDYTLTMNIVKPDNTYKVVEGKLHDKEKAIFEFNLSKDCCDEIGTYRCELLTKCNINDHEEITTSNKLTYKVKSSVLNDLDDIVEAPEYPLVIQLFDKLSDINQYEEDRRANELARQLAEEQRQTRFDELNVDIDNKMTDIENRISAKEQAVDTLIADTKADIDEYKVAKDQEIDAYKTAKDTEINEAIANQDNKIDTAIANQDNKIDEAISNQNDRIAVVENNDTQQDNRLDIVENKNRQQDNRLDIVEAKNVEQDNRLNEIEAIDVAQNTRLDAIEAKNQQQDDRLLDIEKVNKRQDMNLKCLFAESKNNMIDVTEEGNSIYLQNSTTGYTLIDEIQGNTMVNCNKEPDKEIILNGNINTQGYNNVTLTEGVDGGLVDVALEGNTMVNVCDQKDPVAISKAYTVETGNHVALQGEYDGKCRPVVSGNTLVNLHNKQNINYPYLEINTKDSSTSRIPAENGILSSSINSAPNWAFVDYGRPKIDILKPNTVYSIIFNHCEGIDGIRLMQSNATNIVSDISNIINNMAVITTKPDINNLDLTKIIVYGIPKTTYPNNIKTDNPIILEGDYTNKPIPDYFEGLQSSFEDKVVTQEMVDNGEEVADNLGKYKVEYKVTGKNKFDKSKTLDGYEITNAANGGIEENADWFVTGFIPVVSSTSYKISGKDNGNIILRYDKNKKLISNFGVGGTSSTTIPSDVRYIKLNGLLTQKDTFQLEEGDTATEYEHYKEYKKTFYLNSPLLEGDTIEQQGDNVVHVHRSEIRTYETDDELTFPTDMTNTLVAKATPQHEVISQNDTILCDSYVNGHLDMDSVVPIKKVKFISKGLNLKYLYPSAKYNIQFESDNIGKIDFLKLGSWNERLIQNVDITKGVNKLTVTTEAFDSSNNSIYWEGIGFNASNIVVTEATDQDFGYFEGMKSVGECEDLEVKSGNKNILSPIQNPKYPYFIPKGTKLTLSTKDGVPSKGGNVMLYDINGGIQWFSIDSGKSTNTITTKKDIYYIQNQLTITDTIEFQVEIGEVATSYVPYTINTQQLAHEPLRAVGDVKDKYVLIDGKWYIERNCVEKILDGSEDEKWETGYDPNDKLNHFKTFTVTRDSIQSTNMPLKCDKVNVTTHQVLDEGSGYGINLSYYLRINLVNCDAKNSATVDDLKQYLQQNPVTVVYQLSTPVYEPIDYNPFTVYSDVTHISNNSTIPANMIIKNTGYNCLLKPSTTYTVSSNLGLNTVTTPSTLTEDCLRFMDTDTSDVTTMRDVLVLEGDYTTGKPIPSHFSGIESAFEQEYNEAIGKYKVRARIQNEDASKENYIEFYINEPLRGIGDVKDKVYIKNDKVVVERNCGQREYQDGDFGTYLTDKVNTVYQLAEPTYEEVEYNDVKLFIESFKNSTLFYNSNVPVTSTVHYSYSVPIVDTVAKTADVTDQQDQLIIDLATQCAVMEMMLM